MRRARFRAFKCRQGVHRGHWVEVMPGDREWCCRDCGKRSGLALSRATFRWWMNTQGQAPGMSIEMLRAQLQKIYEQCVSGDS